MPTQRIAMVNLREILRLKLVQHRTHREIAQNAVAVSSESDGADILCISLKLRGSSLIIWVVFESRSSRHKCRSILIVINEAVGIGY